MEDRQPGLGPASAPQSREARPVPADPAPGTALDPASLTVRVPGRSDFLLELDEGASFLQLANVLLRRRRLLVWAPFAVAVLAGLISLLVPPTYTATTTFVPESPPGPRLPAGLAGLAGQFGVTPGGDASQSPQFYADLVKSREIMERVLRARYPVAQERGSAADSATLLELLRVRGNDPADSLERGVKKLGKLVAAGVNRKTNVVELRVDARDPGLAALVARRFVDYVNDFNAQTRQSRARQRREFAERRVAEAEQELRRAEEDLKTFYERNRSWQQSPQLMFEEDRLRRQVNIRQEVYLTLKREHETARIDEVNDIPVITVIDPAVPPTRKSKPKRVLLVAVALVLGTVAGVVWAFGAEHVDRLRREDDAEYREFRGLVEQVRTDFHRVAWKVRPRPGVIDQRTSGGRS